MPARTGPTNSLADVAGLRVGHATLRSGGALTGTTVVLAPPSGAVAGVDVRGGGPGTRETDALDPRNLVERIHAVVLTGGSAFGLGTCDGVMAALARDGIGYPVAPGIVVPIVPAAVIFDLGRGGTVPITPDAAVGAAAYDDALAALSGPVAQGVVGAGTGAVAGGLKGGLGSASVVLETVAPQGNRSDPRTTAVTVAALVVVNAVGSCVDPATGELYAVRFGLPGEFDQVPALPTPLPAPPGTAPADPDGPVMPQATTLAVIATDATLTKAQCAKLAGVGHDGMARAIRPVHSMLDGDTVFALATGSPNPMAADPSPTDPSAAGPAGLLLFQEILQAGADCVTRAVAHAMLAAHGVRTPVGQWPSYRDWLAGSAPRDPQ